jgi:hypothetical protein
MRFGIWFAAGLHVSTNTCGLWRMQFVDAGFRDIQNCAYGYVGLLGILGGKSKERQPHFVQVLDLSDSSVPSEIFWGYFV